MSKIIMAAIDKQWPRKTEAERAAYKANRIEEKAPVVQLVVIFSVLIVVALASWGII